MIIDNIKSLICCIIAVLLLLSVCMTVDYADTDITVSNMNESKTIELTNTTVLNDTHYILENDSGVAKVQNDGKVIISKPKYPTITITARPSVKSGYAYRWYTTTWINYCPHCHRYGVLYNAHKYQARHEQELTCHRCGADYCAVTGKEKYSWSHYYLRRYT